MDEESRAKRVDEFLTREFGIHGTWVLAVEVFDEQMVESLELVVEPSTAPWKSAGLSQAASDHLRRVTGADWEEG